MRASHAALLLGLLGACSPAIPDSGAGFDNSLAAQGAREAALAGGTSVNGDPLIPPGAISTEPLAAAPTLPGAVPVEPMPLPAAATPAPVASASSGGNAEDIARETAAALAAAQANSGVAPVQASPSNPAPQIGGNPSISDENDFQAVAQRESIESDAERLARNREQYQQVTPTAVPERAGAASPNIASYALATSNPVGARLYSRSGFNLEAKAQRNCGKYPSPDQAQIAFLDSGGPERDRHGLDPDGDGFACAWNPAPFRQAARN